MNQYVLKVLFSLLIINAQTAHLQSNSCDVRVRLNSGWIRGVCGETERGTRFASFLGVPYAKQPLGSLRFKELQQLEQWEEVYNATREGPVCPQSSRPHDKFMNFTDMDEACISANIYVPLNFLPNVNLTKPGPGLPILVFVHGGGFMSGSGGSNLYGPEYMIEEDVIVITFNYRLNVFGFLYLNTSSVPGNNGLRDMVTLLRWVQANARAFGGDPHNVTLSGHSSGGACVHLLTISKAAVGLFKKAILMSGTAVRSFFTPSPEYAKSVADIFINFLGITSKDPDEIYQQLVDKPLSKIIEAALHVQSQALAALGLITFSPVIETIFPEVTTILCEDPEILMNEGQGNNISLIIGYTNMEGEFFKPILNDINITELVDKKPSLILSPTLVYKTSHNGTLKLAKAVMERYSNEVANIDKYAKCFTESSFQYPAIKSAQIRTSVGGSSVFLYDFAYQSDCCIVKQATNIKYEGATHFDDVALIFKSNIANGVKELSCPTKKDYEMRKRMTGIVKNFMVCSNPTCDENFRQSWPAGRREAVIVGNIIKPDLYEYGNLSRETIDMVQFYDSQYESIK